MDGNVVTAHALLTPKRDVLLCPPGIASQLLRQLVMHAWACRKVANVASWQLDGHNISGCLHVRMRYMYMQVSFVSDDARGDHEGCQLPAALLQWRLRLWQPCAPSAHALPLQVCTFASQI